MTNLNQLLSRIDRALTERSSVAPSLKPERSPLQARVQDALSGALGEAIDVRLSKDAPHGVIVDMPVGHLKASGLRFVESAIPSRSGRSGRSLAGSLVAVKNAEGRVSNIIGEGLSVRALDYDADPSTPQIVSFLVVPSAAAPT